jgi:uncharacterized protein YbaP (TraB family)
MVNLCIFLCFPFIGWVLGFPAALASLSFALLRKRAETPLHKGIFLTGILLASLGLGLTVFHHTRPRCKPYLYIATRNDKRMVILGTCHIGLWPHTMPSALFQEVQKAETLVLEVDEKDLKAASCSCLPLSVIAYAQGLLDMLVAQKALSWNIPVKGLESIAFQRACGQQAFYHQQFDRPHDAYTQKNADMYLLLAVVEAYKKEDLGMHLERSEQALGPSFYKLLSNHRNHAWMPRFEELATEHQNVFVAVGAAHLMGPEGILNLLTQQGWTIVPHPAGIDYLPSFTTPNTQTSL